jgi:hypothetical protein
MIEDDDAINEVIREELSEKSKRGMKGSGNVRNQVITSQSDMAHLVKAAMYWNCYQPANTDDEIQDRIEEFFTHISETGEYPLWEKLCIALGHDRKTVWRWIEGVGCTDRRSHSLKMAKETIGCIDAHLAACGAMPQIVYIFRAKNFYGMVDKQEYTIEPKNTLGNVTDPDDIEKRLTDGV